MENDEFKLNYVKDLMVVMNYGIEYMKNNPTDSSFLTWKDEIMKILVNIDDPRMLNHLSSHLMTIYAMSPFDKFYSTMGIISTDVEIYLKEMRKRISDKDSYNQNKK